MDQDELDAAYTQSVWAPNSKEVRDRYKANSELSRSRIKAPLRFEYGKAAAEGLDVHVPSRSNGKIHIFIHGGAWSGGSASEYFFLVEPFLRAGFTVVIPDFSPVQEAGGNLTVLADQVRAAIVFVYKNCSRFGNRAAQIYLSGHSSGGHLATVALTTAWSSYDVPQDFIKGGLICSGMFDLKPVRLSARSRYIQITDEMETNLSPQRHLDQLSAPLVVAYGTKESPEFQRQSRDFVAAARKAGKDVRLIKARDLNHFEILETMADEDGVLWKAALRQFGN